MRSACTLCAVGCWRQHWWDKRALRRNRKKKAAQAGTHHCRGCSVAERRIAAQQQQIQQLTQQLQQNQQAWQQAQQGFSRHSNRAAGADRRGCSAEGRFHPGNYRAGTVHRR